MPKLPQLELGDTWFRPYFTVDDELRVSSWPEATAQALQRPAERAIGRYCWDLVGTLGCERDCLECGTEVPGKSTCSRISLGADKGGFMVWLDPGSIVHGAPGSATIEGLLVRGMLSPYAGTPDLHQFLDAIRVACGAADCELFLQVDAHQEVVLRDCVGADREAFLQRTRMHLGEGYPGMVTQSCRPLYTDQVQNDDRFLRDAVKRRGIQTVIGVPLLDGGRPLGYLGVAWKQNSIPLGWGLRLVESIQPLLVQAARLASPVEGRSPVQCALRCFGQIEFERGDRRLALDCFPRRKALDLLRHLVLARGAPLRRDTLVELLWPDAPWDAGANRLHVTLNALRKALADVLPQQGATVVQQRHGYYRLDIDALGPIDIFEFSDGIDAARARLRENDAATAISCLEQVLPLYRGELFSDAEDVAFEPYRQRFRRRYREALSLLVNLYRREGRTDAALALRPIIGELAHGEIMHDPDL